MLICVKGVMSLGKELLSQYNHLQVEIEDLKFRINKTKSQIERLESEGTVLDMVKGSRKDGTWNKNGRNKIFR